MEPDVTSDAARRPLDLIVRNGTIVTASGQVQADLGVRDGRVAAIGIYLGSAAEQVEAERGGRSARDTQALQRLNHGRDLPGGAGARAPPDSRPPFVEAEAVGRATTLAEGAGTRLHVHHLSTRDGLERVLEARRRGTRVTCE